MDVARRPGRAVLDGSAAPTWEATDWEATVRWYDVLATLDPSPVVQLNRAVALAERDGPAAGLAALEGVVLPGYALLPATRAELLARLGRRQEAASALREALALPVNDAQRTHLQQRLAALATPQ